MSTILLTFACVLGVLQPQKGAEPGKPPAKPSPREPAPKAGAPAAPSATEPGAKDPAPSKAAAPAARAGALVDYPHPLITEVLYAVPTGDGGDANKDGTRDTNGDEFIELVNPHDRPIKLGGYVISGKGPAGGESGKGKFKTLRFTFPPLELKPGEVVVVFNGHDQKWKTPPGDLTHAGAADAEFSGARVFTMGVESARMGLANKADYVLLTSPSGEKVECVTWGEIKAPEGVTLVEEAPDSRGSVTRLSETGPLEPHPTVDGKKFSPGRFPLARPER
jgi:hypothetical protein